MKIKRYKLHQYTQFKKKEILLFSKLAAVKFLFHLNSFNFKNAMNFKRYGEGNQPNECYVHGHERLKKI